MFKTHKKAIEQLRCEVLHMQSEIRILQGVNNTLIDRLNIDGDCITLLLKHLGLKVVHKPKISVLEKL